MDVYELCGFDFDELSRDDVVPRVRAAVANAVDVVMSIEESQSHVQREPGRWPVVEYCAHVRGVLLTIRDRLVMGLVEHEPDFKSLYRDGRIDLGLYRSDTAAEIARPLESASSLFVRLFSAIEPVTLDRIVQCGQPDPQPRTSRWKGFQAVHEAEHHLSDMEENAARLGSVP